MLTIVPPEWVQVPLKLLRLIPIQRLIEFLAPAVREE
jgi:hypothetical protein